MKIGLYFGSFNPIHVGHCIISSHVANTTDIDQVWLILSPQNPFKASSALLNEYHRLHLAKLAVSEDERLSVSDIEFHLPKPSYTIHTLTYLHEKHPYHEFSIIMGSDSFQNLPKWKNGDLIISHYDLYVYERPGHPISNNIGARLTVLKAPMLEISSTYIRDMIKKRKSIRFLVPDAVMVEIENNGYYR